MSQKECDRYQVIQDVLAKKLTQKQAAHLLKLSTRQLRTLQRRVETEGIEGIVSKKIGKPSNRKYPEKQKKHILERASSIFKDWGPTLISEKLRETDGISVSSEYVRQVMIAHNLWHNRSRKIRQHLPRHRRECFGEMIQADGSKHHWFGEDRPACCLIVMIDDATGKITSLHFAEEETTEAYFCALRSHISQYGIPRSMYTDRHSIFGGISKERHKSQFGRALKELGIESIFAHSPQAKGRVERANKTLQDRLVKELQFQGIKDMESANEFLSTFIESFNTKFSKLPCRIYDAHRQSHEYDLDWIIAHREERRLDRQLTFQYHNTGFVLEGAATPSRYEEKIVSIKDVDEKIEVRLNEVPVKVQKIISTSLDVDSKIIHLKEHRYPTRKNTHPYKKTEHMKQVTNDVLKTNWGYN